MPINWINNDQNIKRVYANMSEHFVDRNITNLSHSEVVDVANFFGKNAKNDPVQDLRRAYDHMYASHAENGQVNPLERTSSPSANNNCQGAESEVTFWKDWLMLHLDLIQQQNDEILNKERSILILQQENEMLKERISCMERGAPFQPGKLYNNHPTSFLAENAPDMTQDAGPCDEDTKDYIHLLDNIKCENGDVSPLPVKVSNCEEEVAEEALQQVGDNRESQSDISNKEEPSDECALNSSGDNTVTVKTESEHNSSAEYDFTISSSSEFDPMKHLRMSIRRKRLSNSSAASNNDSVIDDKQGLGLFKKRRKRTVKDAQILTTDEQYITEAGELNFQLASASNSALEASSAANLEVPRWRVKLYSSCYTLEGTENLDDEVFNKRHSRLENDERRRKRWDVQRIREQRVIEKLKQRQERIGSGGSRSDEQNDPLKSLWPKPEDIKYLEICDHLPVSAFGCPLPKITPSEFSLPWLNNPALFVTKKVPAKRSTVRRKSSKR